MVSCFWEKIMTGFSFIKGKTRNVSKPEKLIREQTKWLKQLPQFGLHSEGLIQIHKPLHLMCLDISSFRRMKVFIKILILSVQCMFSFAGEPRSSVVCTAYITTSSQSAICCQLLVLLSGDTAREQRWLCCRVAFYQQFGSNHTKFLPVHSNKEPILWHYPSSSQLVGRRHHLSSVL